LGLAEAVTVVWADVWNAVSTARMNKEIAPLNVEVFML
jgi:hypothetical protein